MRKTTSLASIAAMAAIAMAGSGLSIATSTLGHSAQAAANAAKQSQGASKAPPGSRGVGSWDLASIFGSGGRSRSRHGYPRPGWPVAVDRRRAAKARRVKANRRAHRG